MVAALNAASAASREVVLLRVLSEGIIYVLVLGLHFLKRKLGGQSGCACDAVVAAAETHFGQAGRAFFEKLTRDKRNWQAHDDALKEFIVGGADGQVKRAASKFALVAMAGELAIE